MKEHGVWDGEHDWQGEVRLHNSYTPNVCSLCHVRYAEVRHCGRSHEEDIQTSPCPGPEEWGLEELFRLYFKLYGYMQLERRGGDSFDVETVDPDIIMSMSSINKGKRYYSDHDYVDLIVDLRKTLEKAIMARV